MKAYLISLAVGLLVGVIYNLLNVRSPAPPVIALIGLLGILVGEQVLPLLKKRMAQGTRGSGLAASGPTACVRFAPKRTESNGEVCGGAIGGGGTSAGLTLSLGRGSSECLARKADAPRSDPTTLSGGRTRVPLIFLHGD